MASLDATSLQLYLRLLRYVKPYWVPFAVSIAGMAIVAATEPALPALLKPLLDGNVALEEDGILAWVPLLIVVVFLVRGTASYVSDYTTGWLSTKIVLDLRVAMFANL